MQVDKNWSWRVRTGWRESDLKVTAAARRRRRKRHLSFISQKAMKFCDNHSFRKEENRLYTSLSRWLGLSWGWLNSSSRGNLLRYTVLKLRLARVAYHTTCLVTSPETRKAGGGILYQMTCARYPSGYFSTWKASDGRSISRSAICTIMYNFIVTLDHTELAKNVCPTCRLRNQEHLLAS